MFKNVSKQISELIFQGFRIVSTLAKSAYKVYRDIKYILLSSIQEFNRKAE